MGIIPNDELRISVTTDCNMMCEYCHNEGNEGSYNVDVDCLRKIIESSKKYGLTKIRLTGGEPLLRKDIYDICNMLVNEYKLKVSINTNGICFDKIIDLVEARLITGVVFGIDKYNGEVSKMSPCGLPTRVILKNILELKKYDIELSISMVYVDIIEVRKMLTWCISNGIRLKVLQQIVIGDPNYDDDYEKMCDEVIKDFHLQLVLNGFEEKCGKLNGAIVVCFYHSLCKIERCDICKNIHLRVTADTKMLYCLQGKYEKTDLRFLSIEQSLKKLEYL